MKEIFDMHRRVAKPRKYDAAVRDGFIPRYIDHALPAMARSSIVFISVIYYPSKFQTL